MSVPTDEIPQARQDAARDWIASATWGQLHTAIQDRLIRALDAAHDNHPVIYAYQALLGPAGSGPAAAFTHLTDPQQTDVLDVLRLRPQEMHAMALDTAIVAMNDANVSADVRTRAVDVACKPLDARRADAEDRQGMVQFYLRDQFDRLMALADVLGSEGFRATSTTDEHRTKILDLVDVANATGFAALPSALTTSETPPSWTHRQSGVAILFDRDLKNEGTALDHIHTVATGTMDERVGFGTPTRFFNVPRRTTRGHVVPRHRVMAQWHVRDPGDELSGAGEIVDKAFAVGELIGETVLPSWNLNQDNRGTCEATSMLRHLALYCPAEYARLASDLVRTGRSTLQDGSELLPPGDAFAADDSNRSPTERLTQSSMMRYWRSGYVESGNRDRTDLYRNVAARRRQDPTNPTGSQSDGFSGGYSRARDDADAVRALTALFGVQYEAVTTNVVARLRTELRDHAGRPVITAMEWGIHRRPSRPRPVVPQGGDSSRAPHPESTISGHAIEVQEILSGPPETVWFWNPWGAPQAVWVNGVPRGPAMGVLQSGTVERGEHEPTRRTEVGAVGLQSMPLSDLTRLHPTIYVPSSGH